MKESKDRKGEKDLRNKLFEKIKDISSDYECDTEVPIPYKHIYLPKDNKNILEIWCFKQDIVFYKKLFGKEVKYKECKIQYGDKQFVEVVLEKDNAQNTKDVGIPFVIIEVKSKQPNSHEILTYSKKFEMIKTIFPFCKFIFLQFEKISPRTFRHGVNFDYITNLSSDFDEEELKKFKNKIKELLNESEKELKRLATNRRFKKKNK